MNPPTQKTQSPVNNKTPLPNFNHSEASLPKKDAKPSGVQKNSLLGPFFDLFLKLRIRSKFSVIIGISVLIVAVILSSTTLQQQEVELRNQTTVLGSTIVQSLAAGASDPLLLNTVAIIQDYIANLKKRHIPGVKDIYVFDRNGKIIARFDAIIINEESAAEEFSYVNSTDSIGSFETTTDLKYIQPIVQHFDGKRIMLGGAAVSFSKEVLLAPIEKMKRMIIATAAIVSLFSIALVFLISGRFVRIITSISDAARRVGEGDLMVAVDTSIKDEVGVLANEFNKMVQQLREKLEMQKYLSRSAVEMLSEEHTATLGGTRKNIIAMFTDIRDFTSAAETLTPEEIVETLNLYLDLQTRIIHDYNGVVDKFLGDGIMAIFSTEELAIDAAMSAYQIQEQIHFLNIERHKNNVMTFKVGIGIATGSAFLGSIGSRDRMDYTAIGDTVNIASRLCSVAGPGEIIVTEDVAQKIKGNFALKPEGKVSIKGKQSQVSVYQIPFSEAKL